MISNKNPSPQGQQQQGRQAAATVLKIKGVRVNRRRNASRQARSINNTQ